MRPRILLIAAVLLGAGLAVVVRHSTHEQAQASGAVTSPVLEVTTTSSVLVTLPTSTTQPMQLPSTVAATVTPETLLGANQQVPSEATLPATTPAPLEGSGGVSGQTPLSVASQFAVAYYSYRYDDAPGAWLASLTPLATPAYSQLLSDRQPTAQQLSARQRAREQASVFVLKATESTAGQTPQLITLEIQVEVSATTGRSGSHFRIQLSLQPSGQTWLVDSLESVAGV